MEQFLDVLKNGCKVERLQLRTVGRLEVALALFMIVAWRIDRPMRLGRHCPEMDAAVMFEPEEIVAAFAANRRELPAGAPMLGEVMRQVAMAGGFPGRKGDGDPGVRTIWRKTWTAGDSLRRGTVSLFGRPAPEVLRGEDENEEIARVAVWLRALREEGFAPGEIGLFVRDSGLLSRARRAASDAGLTPETLSGEEQRDGDTVAVGTMHYAKGVEFRAVAVMACDDDAIPQAARIEAVADPTELDEVYATERHLLYVACTRARERLLVSGRRPVSEFLDDLAEPRQRGEKRP